MHVPGTVQYGTVEFEVMTENMQAAVDSTVGSRLGIICSAVKF
jgi:hypothetical protein